MGNIETNNTNYSNWKLDELVTNYYYDNYVSLLFCVIVI